jgi:hypothetical protein
MVNTIISIFKSAAIGLAIVVIVIVTTVGISEVVAKLRKPEAHRRAEREAIEAINREIRADLERRSRAQSAERRRNERGEVELGPNYHRQHQYVDEDELCIGCEAEEYDRDTFFDEYEGRDDEFERFGDSDDDSGNETPTPASYRRLFAVPSPSPSPPRNRTPQAEPSVPSWWKCTTHGVIDCHTEGCASETERSTREPSMQVRLRGGGPDRKKRSKRVRFARCLCGDVDDPRRRSPVPEHEHTEAISWPGFTPYIIVTSATPSLLSLTSSPQPLYILPSGQRTELPLSAFQHPWHHPGYEPPPVDEAQTWDIKSENPDITTRERRWQVDDAYARTRGWEMVVNAEIGEWVKTEKGDWVRWDSLS